MRYTGYELRHIVCRSIWLCRPNYGAGTNFCS